MIEAEVLTSPVAREYRRKARRRNRTDTEQGLRVLSTTVRQATRGRFDKAGNTLMVGFGQILLAAIARKLKGESDHV